MADTYKDRLGDYVDVAERIKIFRAAYPDGSLQPADPANPYDVVTIGEKTFIVYVAAAYRSHDDTRPGIGSAWEPFPGQTPYTRNSELMVAETSAWGRAIIATLAADAKKIASLDEVRNRQAPAAEHPASPSEAPQRLSEPSGQAVGTQLATEAQIRAIAAISKSMGRIPPQGYKEFTKRQAMACIDDLKQEQVAAADTEEPF